MSRFESSKFLKSPSSMNQEVLKIACNKLGWKYIIERDELIILNIGKNENLLGEYALKVKGDVITYNSYYLKNGKELIEELKKEFYPLNIQYSKQSILQEFEKNGFTFKRDWDFAITGEVADHFYMVGETKTEGEEQKRFEIEFSILNDGTVVSDSNYLPDDVNDLAHLSMDEIEILLGNKRIMTKKEIPIEYRGRITSRTEHIQKLKSTRQ
jgi:hypothetical protein